jgi:hypothetical protein
LSAATGGLAVRHVMDENAYSIPMPEGKQEAGHVDRIDGNFRNCFSAGQLDTSG